jgi:hypothetical protein
LRHYEDACKNEEERSRCRKHEVKNNERLERAKRRVEQIRTIITSIDPANLNSSSVNAENNAGTSSSEATPSADLPFSPETVRLLSNAIANCLQPCNLINKVLNEVYAIIPQVMEHTNDIVSNIDQQDQQQQTEIPKNTTATNTSNTNTPFVIVLITISTIVICSGIKQYSIRIIKYRCLFFEVRYQTESLHGKGKQLCNYNNTI